MCFLRPPHSWFNLLKSGFGPRKSLHSQKKFTVVYMTLPPDATTAGQSAAFPRTLRARARSRAGLIRRHYHGRHCSPASRPHHHVTSGPGPAAGPEPARAAPLSQPAGRSQSALPTTVSVRPASGRQQTGRCGVLTRIRAGAARPQARGGST